VTAPLGEDPPPSRGKFRPFLMIVSKGKFFFAALPSVATSQIPNWPASHKKVIFRTCSESECPPLVPRLVFDSAALRAGNRCFDFLIAGPDVRLVKGFMTSGGVR